MKKETKNSLDKICSDLAADITEKLHQIKKRPFFIFIGGGRATGKSTIAAALQKMLPGSVVVSEDYYIFSPEKLGELKVHVEDPKARDISLMCKHIKDLKNGQVIRIPVEGPLACVPGNMYIDPKRFPIIMIEGTGIFENDYDGLRDYSIFIECSEETAEKRFVDRCLLNPERNPFLTDEQFPKEHNSGAYIDYFREYIFPIYLDHFKNGAKKADQIIWNEQTRYEQLIRIVFPNGRTFFMKPPTAEDMAVRKGTVAKKSYGELFFGGILQLRKADTTKNFINRYGHLVGHPKSYKNDTDLLSYIANKIFDHPNAMEFLKISSKDMPFLWKSQPDIRRGLKWADSAIKLSVEKLSPEDSYNKFQITAELISDAIKLKTKNDGLYIFDNMDIPSFMRLLNVAASIVCNKELTYAMQDDTALMVRNEANIKACKRLGLLEKIGLDDKSKLIQLIKLAAYAGITFPSEKAMNNGDSDEAEREISRILDVATKGKLGIDHTDEMIKIISKSKEITVILDDNGECIPDLLFFQNMLRVNKACKYVFLINKNQIGVNLRAEMLFKIMNYPEFNDIKYAFKSGRCQIISEDSSSESLSYELLSKNGKEAVDRSDLTYIKGQLFFETFNNKSKYTAYVFVPSSSTAITYSGRIRGGVIYICKKDEPRIIVNDLGVVTKTLSEIKT